MRLTDCGKCKKYRYCEVHHILPKKLYPGNDEKMYLCGDCHNNYHEYLGHKYTYKVNKQPMEFYFYKFYKWLFLLVIFGILLYLI